MNIPCVQLWLGNKDFLCSELERYLAAFFSTYSSKAFHQAGTRSFFAHPLVRWFKPPEKGGYKRADFEFLMNEVQRVRGADEPLIIIIEEAQRLNDACANALLKILEEPTEGIFFILGAPARDFVLPTIASRSFVVDKRTHLSPVLPKPLLACFCKQQPPLFEEFNAALEGSELDEMSSCLMVDELIIFWHRTYEDAILNKNQVLSARADRLIKVLLRLKERLPMPGSAKYFWRNLYMMFSA